MCIFIQGRKITSNNRKSRQVKILLSTGVVHFCADLHKNVTHCDHPGLFLSERSLFLLIIKITISSM